MNREERRNLIKQGASKETVSRVNSMTSPCTIAEAVQIARASAEDVLEDYHRNQGNVQLSTSIQVELLKEALFSSGIITEEEFRERYYKKVKEIQGIQEKMNQRETNVTADMKVEAGDVEIKKES